MIYAVAIALDALLYEFISGLEHNGVFPGQNLAFAVWLPVPAAQRSKGKTMNTLRAITLATLTAVAASPVFAFNLNDAVNAASSLQNGQAGNAASTPQAAGLLNNLGGQLKVTPEQAVGGTGAMLGLAKNKLSSSDYSQLTQQVPGLDKLAGANAVGSLGGLLGKTGTDKGALTSALGDVKSTNDLNNAFGALGMNSGMVGQFAPVILQYLGQQGVGGGLLKTLGGIWGTGG